MIVWLYWVIYLVQNRDMPIPEESLFTIIVFGRINPLVLKVHFPIPGIEIMMILSIGNCGPQFLSFGGMNHL